MSFGENIQFLRKREHMTQEDFAEKMGVTRQTVSKWESEVSYPEMDKVVQLCDMFSCSMDALLRNDLESAAVSDISHYDSHFEFYIRSITLGCAVILAGTTLLLFLLGIKIDIKIGIMTLLIFMIAAVTIFIVAGIRHMDYRKKHPLIKSSYTEETIENFNHRFPFFIAVATALIMIGLVFAIGYISFSAPENISKATWYTRAAAFLFLFITVSVPVYVYAGMEKIKYDIAAYNNLKIQSEKALKQAERSGAWYSSIMLTALAVFLILCFVFHLWTISWIVFIIGGILCGIVAAFSDRKD